MAQLLHDELFNESKDHYLAKTYQQDFEPKNNGVHSDAQFFFFTAQKVIAEKLQTDDEKVIRESFRDFYDKHLDRKHLVLIGNLFNGKGFSEEDIPATVGAQTNDGPPTEERVIEEKQPNEDKKHWYDDI